MRTIGSNVDGAFEQFYRVRYLREQDGPETNDLLEALSLGRNDVVVDFGVGDGRYSLPIANHLQQQGGEGIVFGADYNDLLLEQFEKAASEAGLGLRIRPIPLLAVPPGTLPLRDEKIDKIIAVNSVHYHPVSLPLYQEFFRVLKPGGRIVVADWQRWDPEHGSFGAAIWPHMERTRLDLLISGFSDSESLSPRGFHWGLLAEKPL